MSRFWAAASSGSESDSSDASSSDGSSVASGGRGGANENRWLAMSESESSEEEVRVVKSGKERAFETFQAHIKNLKSSMKQSDYYAIQTEFDELAKAMQKAKQFLAEGVPRALVRILVELEDYVAEALQDKAQFKKLSARQGRALNRMKLTLKKHNKAYAVVMEAYRKNPVVSDDEEAEEEEDDVKSGGEESDSESSSSSSSSSSSKSSKSSSSSGSSSGSSSSSKKSGSSESGSESESEAESGEESDWASEESSSSSSDDEAGAYSQLKGRARWLKKNTVVKEKVVKNKEERAQARREARAQAAAAAKYAEAVTAKKSILPVENLTPSILNRKVKELVALRGRRGKDSRELVRELEAVSRLSLKFGPRIEIPILMHVISAQFALQRTMDDYMDTPTWKACAGYLERIANVLDDGYVLGVETLDESDLFAASFSKGKLKAAAKAADGAMAAIAADEKLINPHTGEPETEDERAERLRLEKEKNMTDEEKRTIPVVGSLSLHMTRLEEEYTKSLQHISHHSEEYITRLRNESKLVQLLTRFQLYFEARGMITEAAALAQLRIEHIYYRHDTIAWQVDKAAAFYEKFGEQNMLHPACVTVSDEEKAGTNFTAVHPGAALGKPAIESIEQVNFTEVMTKLCHFVYKHGSDLAKTRATICQVYHHALHDRFVDARDLLLMSHLQETIYSSNDVSTMVLFNRMMVTLGMSAFRSGRIYDAHQCLSDICSGRVRELLAQGVNTGRHNDKSAEQEKAEKRRQVPYHQHINLDLLESCHLISAMLLEIPNMAGAAVDGDGSSRRHRYISRTFRKFFDQYNHQVFTGPPEQTRDFVMRASKALMKGDWKTCADFVANLDVWQLFPGDDAPAKVGDMLTSKIKVEGLRTYLFAFSSQYDSLSLSQLCGMFEMTKNEVHSIVSRMMINRELIASWDQPTETIVLRKVEPTSLQVMALQFAEKAASLVEANERLLEVQSGGHTHKDEYWKGDDDRWRGRTDGHHRGGQRYTRRTGGGSDRRDGGDRGGGGSANAYRGRGRRY